MWVTTPLLQKQVGKMKMAVIQKCLGVQKAGRSTRRMEEQPFNSGAQIEEGK